MFPGCTGQSYCCYTIDKIGGFLLDCFAFVVLRGTRGTIMTAQYTCFGLLYTTRLGVDKRDRRLRETNLSRGRVKNEGQEKD